MTYIAEQDKSMRILHVIPSVSPNQGGPSFAVRMIAESLVACGTETHVVTTDDDEPAHLAVSLNVPIQEKGVTYYYFRRQTHFYKFSWPLTFWLSQHLSDYDVVHIHALFSYATIPAALFAQRAQIPYIIRPLGTLNRWGREHRRPFVKQLSLKYIEGPLVAKAAAIHYTCEQERIEAEETGISAPAAVVPLGLNLPSQPDPVMVEMLRSHYPQLRDRLVLLFLSRLHPKKGLELLLQAFAQVRQRVPQIVLIVAGTGEPEYEAELQGLASALQLQDSVIWIGFITGSTKSAILTIADLFILPSYSENFGIAVVEAMAMGLPVLISDQVGIHHEVTEANAGVVVSCHQEAVTPALEYIALDAELRQQMGANAKKLAKEKFSQQAMSRSLLELYRTVLYPPTRRANVSIP